MEGSVSHFFMKRFAIRRKNKRPYAALEIFHSFHLTQQPAIWHVEPENVIRFLTYAAKAINKGVRAR